MIILHWNLLERCEYESFLKSQRGDQPDYSWRIEIPCKSENENMVIFITLKKFFRKVLEKGRFSLPPPSKLLIHHITPSILIHSSFLYISKYSPRNTLYVTCVAAIMKRVWVMAMDYHSDCDSNTADGGVLQWTPPSYILLLFGNFSSSLSGIKWIGSICLEGMY